MKFNRDTLNQLYLLFLVIIVIGLWDTSLIYPLKLLVVFFHESSHALVTILTGGSVVEMAVTVNQGGHVMSSGGSRFLTLSAGYLGSLVWGATIYLLALRSRLDEVIAGALGLIVILITLFFVRNMFGFVFGLLTGGGMMLLANYGNEQMNDLMLRLIGITNMIYVPLDIYSDTISRSYLRSDARMLAEEFGGATIMWGGIWIAISIVVLYNVVRAKGKSVKVPYRISE